MLASTWLDIVIGIDLHFELVPPPMLPVPFPHPFVGLVLDPIGLLSGLAISNAIGMASGGSFMGPVLINLMPANTTGTEAKNLFLLPHFIIPPGVIWAPMVRVPKPRIIPGKPPSLELPIPPPGDAVMITGSKTVHAMGANLCRLGDIALSCSDPIRLPSSVVLTIPKGLPVLVGGPPAVDWAAAAFGLIKCKWVADRLHRLVNRIKSARLRNLLHKGVCFLTGHPVDVATGRVMTDATDFALPGPLPLAFARSYVSSWSHRDSPLGHGWSHSLDQAVWLEEGRVVYRAEDGREIEFDTFDFPDHAIRPGDEVFEPLNRLTLRSLGHFRWEIEGADGIVREFAPVAGDRDRTLARLTKQRARTGHEISLHHDARGHLEWARDAGGRVVRFAHDGAGRLVEISLPHPTQEGWVPHTRYVYSAEGDLVEVVDPLGNRARYEYAGHLLVRETDRTGLSFYFGYDGAGPDARCIRTWGDGGIYDHELHYDKANRVTFVTNSLDATTTYEMNAANAVVKVVDPLGGETRYAYDDDLRKTAEIDPLGNETRYAYDARGNRTRIDKPGGVSATFEYHPRHNVVVRAVDPNGGAWLFEYDASGRRVARVSPDGQRTRYERQGRELERVVHPGGAVTERRFDARGDVAEVRLPSGAVARFRRDNLGRVVERVTELGGVERRQYDAAGRLVRAETPLGQVVSFEYDAEGNPVRATDGRREVQYAYTGYHKLAEYREAGAAVRFAYDTEGRLVAAENEAGERYTYELDPRGYARSERGFDGAERRYRRDAAGRVTAVRRAGGSQSLLRYDDAGRLSEVDHADGTFERYRYRADGALVAAINEAAEVRFDVDPVGQVVEERVLRAGGGEHWVRSGYGPGGARVWLATSDDHGQRIERDAAGRVRALEADSGGHLFRAEFERDALGHEVARRLPGGVVHAWERDAAGRPRRGALRAGDRPLGERTYAWDGEDELRAIVDDELGTLSLEHDARGRLISARLPSGERRFQALDAAGNIYRSPDRSDRRYGPGGRLEQAGGQQYRHDADGRLVEKRDELGRTTRYSWNAAGTLREIALPDGGVVRFAYDAFARRLSKQVLRPAEGGALQPERVVQWHWDGAIPITEVSSDEGRTTWVFEPETASPLARLARGRAHSVLTDPVGTPTHLVDEAGELAWRAPLDPFHPPRADAETEAETGAKTRAGDAACPFGWPGQYRDRETGLYYHRYRYFDPSTGLYLSSDPIGLAGGLRQYGYPHDPLTAWDPFGLLPEFIYRALRPDEMGTVRTDGLTAKDPTATYTPMEHVVHGSEPDFRSQYISMTTDEGFANSWARNSGTAYVVIDTSRLPPDSTVDLSTGPGRTAAFGDVSAARPGTDLFEANRMARNASEVLGIQHIPADAIVDIRAPVAGRPPRNPPAGGCT
ncbi:DUF6531 domain-containing protein [Sorangium sp. So ce854]|uniref:DUF6531 domain-containing protein n=1 Tax=Sorangium sp. So ce854 TaxID=3133322 RepID=UPI003F647BB3